MRGEGMVSPNDGRTGPNDKGAKMQTSLAAAPRARSSEDHSKLKLPFPTTNNGLMMEVWASVASWFFRPDATHPSFPPAPLAANLPNVRGASPRPSNARSGNEHGRHFATAPTICTAIRCTVPGCSCDCFTPGKIHIRYCETCSHGWVPHALDKLGFKHLYDQHQVEPVQPNVAFDIASLVLYGTQALPIRLKILLDRLFSVLQREEVLQVLHGFGWTQEDYARGYILQEPHGNVLERWNICSPEEEPLVLQQFLRFGETRAITQQLLLAQADQAAALASSLCGERERDRSFSDREKERDRERDRDRDRDRERQLQLQHQLKIESDLKKAIERSGLKPSKSEAAPSLEEKSKSHRDDRSRTRTISPPRRPSPPHPQLATNPPVPSARPSPAAPPSPLHKQSPLNLLKLPAQNGPNSSGSSPPASLNSSPLSVSPLNRLQSMQPFDFRKVGGSSPFSVVDSGRRRASESADTSPSLNVTSPPWHLPPPLPPSSSDASAAPVNLSHSAISSNPLAAAAGLVAPPFTNLMSSTDGRESKSPSMKTEKGRNSEFGSEEDEEDDENLHSALNLSRDGGGKQIKKPNHQRKGMSPIKRTWGTSSALPLNLGTQLINPATGKKRVQCNVCLKTFCDKGALKIHFSAVHLREMHKCTVEGCNMMFSSRRSRNRHSANPNPKLHSPHLRRKISPHDGRSSQSHPILIPPHGALSLPGGGLNPLSFGAFPLLTPPPDIRHQTSALDLKQSLDLTLMKYDDRRTDFSSSTNQSSDDAAGTNANSQYDDMEDEEDYEGIVVVGDDEQDQELEEQTDKNMDEETGAKRLKLIVSDADETGSNVDSNEDSLGVVDNHSIKEEPATEGKISGDVEKPRRGRKRKNQNPTRCAIPVRRANDDGLSTDGEESQEPDNLFMSKQNSSVRTENDEKNEKSEHKTEEDNVKERTEAEDKEESRKEFKKDNIRAFDAKDEHLIKNEIAKRNPSAGSPCRDQSGDVVSPLSHLETFAQDRFGDGKTGEGTGNFSGTRATGSGRISPSRSPSPTRTNGPESPGDENNEGCNASFPSKRSRDRHSSNLNLHRKLLSTTPDKTVNLWDKGPFLANSTLHADFLSRLYSETQSIPLAYPETFKNHPHLVPDGLLNGERVIPPNHLPFPSLAFPNLGFPSANPFLSNGLDRRERRSSSASPGSPPPSSSPSGLSVDFDVPTPDREGLLPCKYCAKPFSEGGSLKEHYEQVHGSELFRCTVEGCAKAFTSRSKRNSHCERHAEASARRRGSSSSAEHGS